MPVTTLDDGVLPRGVGGLGIARPKGSLVVVGGLLYESLDSAAPSYAELLTTASPGIGDVVGPTAATNDALVRFDGATGKLIQNSNATLTDVGKLSLTANAQATGLSLPEQADHPEAPTAGVGQLWADDAAGTPLMYTTDTGVDAVVAAPYNVAMAANDIDAKLGAVQTKTVNGATVLTASNFAPGMTVLLILAVAGSPVEPTWPGTTVTLGSRAWDPAVTNYVFLTCTSAGNYVVTITQAA